MDLDLLFSHSLPAVIKAIPVSAGGSGTYLLTSGNRSWPLGGKHAVVRRPLWFISGH